MLKLFFLLVLSSFTFINNSYAQGKYEKESRIKKAQVPKKALLFLDSINDSTKIKWYKEEALDHESIEAKFRHNKSRYSVEFDTLGNVEDIEIETKAKDIDAGVTDVIVKQLRLECSKFRIIKIQKQYIGSEYDLFTFLHKGLIKSDLHFKYEIVVRCNSLGGICLTEYLFSEQGVLVDKNKIIFKNSSHLEY